MRALLQEVCDFEKYKNCLDTELCKVYQNYLVEKVLNEMTPKFLARNFGRIFSQNELDTPNATAEAISKLKRAALKTSYSTQYNRIKKR